MTSALGSLLPTGDKGSLHDPQTKQEKPKTTLFLCMIFIYLIHDVHALVCIREKKDTSWAANKSCRLS